MMKSAAGNTAVMVTWAVNFVDGRGREGVCARERGCVMEKGRVMEKGGERERCVCVCVRESVCLVSVVWVYTS